MLKRSNFIVMALLLFWSFGCSNDPERPSAPAPPPQIALQVFSETSPNPATRLPDNEVFDIFVDTQNRTWFTTESGIAMSDGSQAIAVWDDFAPDRITLSGLPNRKCRGITEFNGKIWVGTWGGGVAYLDVTGLWVALPIGPNRVVDENVFDVAADDTSLWIATVNGVSQYVDDDTRPMAARFHQHSNRLGKRVGDLVVTSVVVDKSAAEVWLSKLPGVNEPGGGITVLTVPDPFPGDDTMGEIQFRPENTGIPDKRVSEVAIDPTTGFFWASFSDVGLGSVDAGGSVWRHFTTVDGFFSDLAQSVAVKSNGDVWVGTLKGVSRMRVGGGITNFTAGSGLPSERVRKVYVDNQDRVWLAFTGAGAGRVQ